MLRRQSLISFARTALIAAAILACPSGILAQRGAGGGHSGGGLAGAGGLSGGSGRATGLDTKDDLKDFHRVLALQATSQQITDYKLMMKSTEAANVELQALTERLGEQNHSSEIAPHGATVDKTIDKARSDNKQFLDNLSPAQKAGLKEIIKKLAKADAELAQQTKALTLEITAPGREVQLGAGSAGSLERALKSFRTEQLDLGQEMSIGGPGQEQSVFEIQPLRTSINLVNQPENITVNVTTTGTISREAVEAGQNIFKLELTTDLSDLQLNIADVMRAALNKSETCGDQVAIRMAAFTPQSPSSLVGVQLHFERWTCHGQMTNEMLEGDGSIEVKLTPQIGADGGLQLIPVIGRVDAEGLLGESLRSGSLGEMLRDRIAESLLSALRRNDDLKTLLPVSAHGSTTLQHAKFQGTGSGHIQFLLDGEIRLANEKAAAFVEELKGKSASQAASQKTVPEAMPR
jgi:hypothetical protein